MKKKIESLLKSIGLFPLNKKHWRILKLRHIKPRNKVRQEEIKIFIKQQVGNVSGVYIYKNKRGKILYVGKGKSLKGRLYSHYLESFKKVPGDTNDYRWHRFFSSNRGQLTVYWNKVDYEKDRRIIEHMLEFALSPKFLTFTDK